MPSNKQRVILILSSIRSLYNVGAIFRSADAFGIEKIYLCGITGTPDGLRGNKISKTALGADDFIPWEYSRTTAKVVKDLKKDGWQIIGLENKTQAQPLNKLKPKNKTALIVGNEVKGISKSIQKKCDKVVEIPMQGQKESLNVSVAAGIVLYALRNTKN